MSLNKYIAKQFANPRGTGGRIVMAVMNRQNAQMYEVTERLLRPQAGDTVLDIGCGNGVMMGRVARRCDCRLIGTDISGDVLKSAKHRLKGKNVELLCCPVDDMPIENATVKLYYAGDEMRIELQSANGELTLDCPYADIIHIRYDYGANAYFGGGASGGGEYKDLLGNLQTLHVIKESIPKSLEASLSLKGILSMKTVADVDKKTLSRDEFEQHLFDSKYGIVATDYESDFTPININATDIPTNILSFLRDEILSPFGVSLPIFLGKYTDSEYTAFYQTAVEGLLMSIAESMKVTLFTPRQLAYGHTIKYYDKLVQSLSFERRQQIAELTKDDALLSRDERRELLGYEPDGQPTRVSLNYINATLADKYQMQAIKGAGKASAAPDATNNDDTDADAPDKKEGDTDVE